MKKDSLTARFVQSAITKVSKPIRPTYSKRELQASVWKRMDWAFRMALIYYLAACITAAAILARLVFGLLIVVWVLALIPVILPFYPLIKKYRKKNRK